MTKRFWRLLFLLVLLLLTTLAADAQRRSGRVIEERYRAEERYRDAARELARTNPEAIKKLREEFHIPDPYESLFREDRHAPSSFNFLKKDKATERLGSTFNEQIGAKNFRIHIYEQDQQQVLRLESSEPSVGKTYRRVAARDRLIGRKLIDIMRRDEILREVGAKEVIPLETRRRDKEAKSELEAYLEKVGVADYAVVAKSSDVNARAYRFRFEKEVTLLRIFGGESKPIGRYLFCCLENPENAPLSIRGFSGEYARWTDASGLATPPSNLLEDLALVRLPAGTEVIASIIADNFKDAAGNYRLGGNTQFFLPAVKDFPYEHYRLAGMVSDPSDIVVQFDGGKILRFRRSSSLDGPTR